MREFSTMNWSKMQTGGGGGGQKSRKFCRRLMYMPPSGTLHLYLCSPFGQACSFRCLSAAPLDIQLTEIFNESVDSAQKSFESSRRLKNFGQFSFEVVNFTLINIKTVRVTYSSNPSVIKNELSTRVRVRPPPKDTTQSVIASPTEMRRAVVMLLLCVSP